MLLVEINFPPFVRKRHWPDVGVLTPWAEPGNPEGARGVHLRGYLATGGRQSIISHRRERLYGHLEQPTANGTRDQVAKPGLCCDTDSSSDVEIGDSERIESAADQPVWATPLPLCPRPVLLPHQQLAFGAGLAAFCET
ncbi:hypothetical protein EVAR_6665_1 [Eumeta japonica]|uniref:Uncharacterized protein n=1 Tax=Eumeta variegata TaxID=151549 RepID=A0A4C1TKI9_EUMVA|nr:hypothetical protein EVAR_6665_1 [Eumeta japonica]